MKEHHLRFVYLLAGALTLSAGILHCFPPRGSLFQTQGWTHSSQCSSARLPHKGSLRLFPASVQVVGRFYEAHGRSGDVFSRVPRLFSVNMPSDIRQVKNSRNRRQAFIQVVLPLILEANERILEQRARLLAIEYKQHHKLPLTSEERVFLRQMAREYRVLTGSVASLLKRVDQVPPSLALAQSMLETGCGTSCAAITKRSIFGHMATATQVQPFTSLSESVTVYCRNLNRNAAYSTFRSIREQMRTTNKPLSGAMLADGLVKYSERGRAYIRDLQKLIRLYRLEEFDKAIFVS